MRRQIIGLVLALTLAGMVVIGISFYNQLACEGQPINNNVVPTQSQQIWGEQIISQSFVAPRSHLNRIDIFFQTYQRRNRHEVILGLHETSPGDNSLPGKALFKTTFNAASISDQSWRTFTFPAIADSAGKRYLIVLQSPESVDGDAITVGGIERDIYQAGSAFLGQVPLQADITFRACFQMNAAEKFQVLARQITQNRPALWGRAGLYGLFVIGYLFLLIGFYWQLIRLASR